MEEENKKVEEEKEQKQETVEKAEKVTKEEKPKKKSKKVPKKETKPQSKEETKEEKVEGEKVEQIIQEAVELIEEQKQEEIVPQENKEIEVEEKNNEQNKNVESEEEKEPIEPNKKENTEKQSEQFVPVGKPQKNKKKGLVITFSIVLILLIMSVFSIAFALMNINNKKILKGISILEIDVGELTVEDAKKRINDAINQKFSNEKDSLVLRHGELEVSVNANTFNAKFDVDTAVAEAYNIGRGGNIVTNNYAILWNKFFPKEIEAKLHWDEEFMNTTISDTNSKMKDAVVDYSYYIEDKKLIVVKGKEGYIIQKQELQNQIVKQLENIHTPYQEIEIPVEKKQPSPIDIEKIRKEIYKEPKDAYVERNPTKVHVEEDGIDFGISLEEAKKLIQEEKEEYEIPLKITQAKRKLADLGEEAFSEQLATFSTIYDASARNRAYNVELATKKINGTIIRPGETFSYNKTVGSRTIEAGWKEGTAYIAGKVVPSVGGGVCQVSSTLYNTALLANLEITERTNHTFTVDYVAASRDATVYYGSLDFCFKNTRTYPIKIVATAQNGVCKISMYGIKEDVEYEVIIQSKITSYINNTTTYKEDPTLEEGKEVVEQIGFPGCRSEGYKIVKHNGKIISQTLLSKDTYSPQERIVRRGTKK